jgi:hypothetical protein
MQLTQYQLLGRVRQEDHFNPGVQDQPGQHNEITNNSKKRLKSITSDQVMGVLKLQRN